jgi:periplasmic protein TonB
MKLSLKLIAVVLSILLIGYSIASKSEEKGVPKDINILIKQIADEKQRKYMERPRRRTAMAQTKYYPVAPYIAKWREKVERLGNVNYPIAARSEHLHGNVMVTVSIMADGTVEAAKINISSGHKILDDHVLDTIRKAAPFELFSEELNDYADILTIERAWISLSEPSPDGTENSF